VREREKARRNSAEPNRTLFVAGFDPRGVRTRDLEKAFEEFGRLAVRGSGTAERSAAATGLDPGGV
jgi:hypothetical protein